MGPTTPLSTAVAVLQGAFWHRGLLQALSQYGRRLRARVFLTDYGTTLEEVEVEGRVLLLPPALSLLPPLAFLVVLAGLQPASMDLDLCQVREVREGHAGGPRQEVGQCCHQPGQGVNLG